MASYTKVGRSKPGEAVGSKPQPEAAEPPGRRTSRGEASWIKQESVTDRKSRAPGPKSGPEAKTGASFLQPSATVSHAKSESDLSKRDDEELKLAKAKKEEEALFSSSNQLNILGLAGAKNRAGSQSPKRPPVQLGRVVGAPDQPDSSEEVMNWSMKEQDRADLRNRLSDVLGRRAGGSRSPTPTPAPELPRNMPAIPPPKSPQQIVSPRSQPIVSPRSQPTPQRSQKSRAGPDEGADVELDDAADVEGWEEPGEHLLKPSDVRSKRPAATAKGDEASAGPAAQQRAPKNITKETLMDMYNAMWEKADDIPEPEIIKCGLPEAKRTVEVENNTDVEYCIQRLFENDPTMTEVNLNNMKRTPVPQIQRLLEAARDSEHLKLLSLANLGLSDTSLEPLIETLQVNKSVTVLNIETNYLSGDFLARLFAACLQTQVLQEVKAVNQSATFSNQAELAIMRAIHQNRSLWKVSLNLRLPEARQKVDKALIRNGELRRLKRQIDAMQAAAR